MHPLESYARAGRTRRGLWRVLPGMVLVLACWLGWTVLVASALVGGGLMQGESPADALSRLDAVMSGGGPEAVAMALMTFLGIWPGVWLALRLLHGQSFLSTVSAPGVPPLSGIGTGLLIGTAFFAVTVLGAILTDGLPTRTDLPVAAWAPWAMVVLVLVWGQAGGEELIFRGYLLQQLAARWRSMLVWGVLPSAIFGLLHFQPGQPGAMVAMYVGSTFLIGMACALTVARTGGIGMAIGLHVANNIPGLMLVGIEGTLSGAQLWSWPAPAGERLIAADLVSSVALLAGIAIWLRPRPLPG